MQFIPIKTRKVLPPKDTLAAVLRESSLAVRDGDIIAISSKVVSIGEGACVPIEGNDKKKLVLKEAQWYRYIPSAPHKKLFTIARGVITGSSGIDESNGNGHYILYPRDPFKSARWLRRWIQKTYGVTKIGIIITDSKSDLLRRGAIGFALAWDGFDPLRDYRGMPDLFGRPIRIEMANLVDAMAAAAGLYMGEVDEQTPVVVLRYVPNIVFRNRSPKKDWPIVQPDEDIFSPVVFRPRWRRGGAE